MKGGMMGGKMMMEGMRQQGVETVPPAGEPPATPDHEKHHSGHAPE